MDAFYAANIPDSTFAASPLRILPGSVLEKSYVETVSGFVAGEREGVTIARPKF